MEISKQLVKGICLLVVTSVVTGRGYADSPVASDDFDSYSLGSFNDPTPPGSYVFVGFDASSGSAKIVSPGAQNDKQALEFSALYKTGFNLAGVGFHPIKQPHGNKSKDLADYTISFDFALVSGFTLDPRNLEVHLLGDTTKSAVLLWPDTNSIKMGGGFVHFSVSLNDNPQTLNGMPLFDPTDPALRIEFVVGKGGLDNPVTEIFRVDNVQITKK